MARLLIIILSFLISACGFTIPQQENLNVAIPKIVVLGDKNNSFVKLVVNDLKQNGVEVLLNAQDTDKAIPKLSVANPVVEDFVVAVDTSAQALERNLQISTAATLFIDNYRPIAMKNSISRTILNKSGNSLASQNEYDLVISETLQTMANQLIVRLSYLGKQSNPDIKIPTPGELTLQKGEFLDDKNETSKMSLIEALQKQDAIDRNNSTTISLDKKLSEQSYKLPSVKPKVLDY